MTARQWRRTGVLLILAAVFLGVNIKYGDANTGYLGAGLILGLIIVLGLIIIHRPWRGVLIDRDRERRRY